MVLFKVILKIALDRSNTCALYVSLSGNFISIRDYGPVVSLCLLCCCLK